MKFNPKLHSYLFALNLETEEEELEIIKRFSPVEPTKLLGQWRGVGERSYQINAWDIDKCTFILEMVRHNQEAYIEVYEDSEAFLHKLDSNSTGYSGELGKFVIVSGQDGFSTYCPETKTHWQAMK